MNTETTLLEAERAHRAQMATLNPAYGMPPVMDAFWFCLTELAELLEARLRNQPQYARTNIKTFNERAEMGDLLRMLATAQLAMEGKKSDAVSEMDYELAVISQSIGWAAIHAADRYKNAAKEDVEQAISHCIRYCKLQGWDAVELQREVHERVVAKHGRNGE